MRSVYYFEERHVEGREEALDCPENSLQSQKEIQNLECPTAKLVPKIQVPNDTCHLPQLDFETREVSPHLQIKSSVIVILM